MAHLAWQGMGGNDSEKRLNHYRRHGVPPEQAEAFRGLGNNYRKLVPSVAPSFRAVREGDVVTIGGRRWHAFTVMGHAPEHACLFSPEANVLISGDQVLPKITTNVSVWPDQPNGNPLKLYLDSLGRFRPLPEETLVLPSHGLPFIGLHKRLDYLQHHHDERFSEAIDALAEPRTAHELVPVLFRRQLDTHQLGFAIGETVAHLHFLEARGQVARLVDGDGRAPLPQGLASAWPTSTATCRRRIRSGSIRSCGAASRSGAPRPTRTTTSSSRSRAGPRCWICSSRGSPSSTRAARASIPRWWSSAASASPRATSACTEASRAAHRWCARA